MKVKSEVYSWQERENSHSVVSSIIDMLDTAAINELLQGTGGDIDRLFDILTEETHNIINLKAPGVNTSELNYLPELKRGYEHFLRCSSLSYFTSSCLPDFDIQWFHVEWMNMIQLYKYLCIIASRDHSKSFTFSFANILWGLYRYERPTQLYIPPLDIQLCKETMLITNEFSLAKRLLKKVKAEVEINPILQERLLPDSRAAGWGETALTCKNGAEMTLSSFHSSNRGPHPGRIIVDDFLDKSTLYSKAQREKFREVFTAEVMNMILPHGQVCVVGTPFHEQDLYSDLKKDPNWKVFEYPAIFPDGRILYDNRYNYEALCAKRQSLGSLIFSREILVKPVTDNVSIFPWSILEISFINMQNLCLVQNRQSYPVKFKKVSVGCDFALSANVAADNTVYTVVGIDSLDQIHLIHSLVLHGAGYNEQIISLQRICSGFQPETVVMEVNGFQRIMAQNAKERGVQNIIEFSTDGFQKRDLYEGLPSLAVLFETGVIKMPRGDDYSKQTTDAYCSELNSMAFDSDKGKLESVSEHDDRAVSLFLAIKGIKTVNSEFRVSMIES